MKQNSLLLKCKHGLGDQVQATIIIRHLKWLHPDLFVGIECPVGQEAIFRGVADAVHGLEHPFWWKENYSRYVVLDMPRCDPKKIYSNCPSTKPTVELHKMGIDEPQLELYKYTCDITEANRERANRYVTEELPEGPFALIHYQGVSCSDKKNLTDDQAGILCGGLANAGITPVVLDWHRKAKPGGIKPDNIRIFNPDLAHWLWNGGQGSPDSGDIAALIERADFFFGIDSGPGHLAGATNTPSYIFWTHHHPLQFYDLADNVTHVFGVNAYDFCEAAFGSEFFADHYKQIYYGEEQTLSEFLIEFAENLTAENLDS